MFDFNNSYLDDIVCVTNDERKELSEYALKIVDYRRTGISLNHIIGCPMDCAYCVRHFWGNFKMKIPHMLCSDEEAVSLLINDVHFIPNRIPIQFLHKATDPFLPSVKKHTFTVLKRLDDLKLHNIVMLITRFAIKEEDLEFLNSLVHIQPCIFVTYSGITDKLIEPVALSGMFQRTIQTLATRDRKAKCKFVQYWRPLVKGWNDDEETIRSVLSYSNHFDAIVIKGLRHKKENDDYFKEKGIQISHQYGEYKKWFDTSIYSRINFISSSLNIETPIFTKTSCAISCVCKRPDYNLQYLQKKECERCTINQRELCATAINDVNENKVLDLLSKLGNDRYDYTIHTDCVEFSNVEQQDRNFFIHYLQFPCRFV